MQQLPRAMELTDRIRKHFEESIQTKMQAVDSLAQPIADAAQALVECLVNDGKILICGNGGSAADSQHFAAELINRFEIERPGLAAIALTTDSSILTSIANDYNFNQVFSRQVRALGMSGDMLIAISTSGNSINVVEAIYAARERDMRTIALTGREGGTIGEILEEGDYHLCVHSDSTARTQEVHLLILHCLCDAIDHLVLGGE